MLITFSSKVHHDVVMFGDVGLAMLRGMGVGDRVPGALRGDDVGRALTSLRAWLARRARVAADHDEAGEEGEGDEKAEPIALEKRALPLLDMLEAAARQEEDVIWE